MWRHAQAARDGFFGQQSGGEHQHGVGGVGAGGDGGDGHGTVAQLIATGEEGGGLLPLGGHAEAALFRRGTQRGEEAPFDFADRLEIVRAFRAGDGGDNGAEVQFDHARIRRLGGVWLLEQALATGIFLDQFAMRGGAAGHAQVGDGFGVHGEEPGGGAIFGGHVREHGAVGEREARAAGAEVFHKLAHDIMLTEQLGDGQREIGGGDAGA